MIHRRASFFLCTTLLAASGGRVFAAQPPAAAYDPAKTFAPLSLPDPVNSYRSSNGAPGPDYWQNSADYEIHANLDTAAKQLSAAEVISYVNNSPDALPSLWVQLDQNIYRKDARSNTAGWTRKEFTDGFVFDSIEIEAGGHTAKTDYIVSDTRMQIRLADPLKARGGRLKIHIQYHYAIPGVWGGRTSWGMSKKGEIYDMAQWYPRMAVYDDLHGWDTLPYIGSEFYLEYGNFDYYVTLPSNMLIAGSGELKNPREVLTATETERLAQARASDKTIMIRTPQEVDDAAGRPQRSSTLTWHFHMDNTRDVAFSTSSVFVWDAARINLPDGAKSLAMSVYPVESVGDAGWGRSTEYLKHAVEQFSRKWFPYPYPAAINVAGYSTGMEYPGIVFDGIPDQGKQLFWITAHEIGHTWFPMIVGSNERRNAWMDEGFNTFIDTYESDEFQNGVYGPKRDSEYSAGGEPPDTILKVLNDPAAPVILTRADGFPRNLGHPVSYFKAAYGLRLLREQILGPERFDWAFRKYIRDWAYKHPSPSDFFRAMESEGGEDLSYFWRGWFMNNWTLDMAVKDAQYVKGDYRQGVSITIANLGQLVLPNAVQVNFEDGSNTRVKLPVEAWISKGEYTFTLDSKQPILSIVLDPDHVIPDNDRSNDVLKK
jgi:Peptidase family M1 domain